MKATIFDGNTGWLCSELCTEGLQSTFVDGVLDMGFQVISRFRDDVYFRYLTKEKPTGSKGRPKLYDGKTEIERLEEDRFEIIPLEQGQGRILSAIVYRRALKRNVLLCIWESENKKVRKLYFREGDVKMLPIRWRCEPAKTKRALLQYCT